MTSIAQPTFKLETLPEILAREAAEAAAVSRVDELEKKVAALEFQAQANQEVLAYFLKALFIRFPELELHYQVLAAQVLQ